METRTSGIPAPRGLRYEVKPNAMGRSGYDPADMLKLYIYGYLNRVRSSLLSGGRDASQSGSDMADASTSASMINWRTLWATARRKSPSSCLASRSARDIVVLVIGGSVGSRLKCPTSHLHRKLVRNFHHVRGCYLTGDFDMFRYYRGDAPDRGSREASLLCTRTS